MSDDRERRLRAEVIEIQKHAAYFSAITRTHLADPVPLTRTAVAWQAEDRVEYERARAAFAIYQRVTPLTPMEDQ
jgi:hypothetical protein